MSTTQFTEDFRRNPADLEREAADVRADVEQTLESLEHLLSPTELLHKTMSAVRENSGEFGRNFAAQIRNNPVPTVLAGVGLAWLMAASRKPRSYASDATADTHGAVSGVVGATRHAADSVRHSARRAADTAEAATEAVHDASVSSARRVRDAYVHLRDEQPLLLGAIAVAAGVAIGALLPQTETEDRWLGAASEDAATRMKKKSAEALDAAKEEIADVAEAAQAKASEIAEQHGAPPSPPGREQREAPRA
jgi:hypothetical protein